MIIYKILLDEQITSVEMPETIDKVEINIIDQHTLILNESSFVHRLSLRPVNSFNILAAYNNVLVPNQQAYWKNLTRWPKDFIDRASTRIFVPSDLSTMNEAIIECGCLRNTRLLINGTEDVPVFTIEEATQHQNNLRIFYEVDGPTELKPGELGKYSIQFKNAGGVVPAKGNLHLINTAGYVSRSHFIMKGESHIEFTLRALDLEPGDSCSFECGVGFDFVRQADRTFFKVDIVE